MHMTSVDKADKWHVIKTEHCLLFTNKNGGQTLSYFIITAGAFKIVCKQNICNMWHLNFFFFSMPPRGLVLTSVSARWWLGELSMSWMVLLSVFYQDNSYFSTDKVGMCIDWWEFHISLMLFDCQVYWLFHRGHNSQSAHIHLTCCVGVFKQIWLCQNLVKLNSQFVKLLVGPQKQTCMFQIKRLLGFCCRYSTEKKE